MADPLVDAALAVRANAFAPFSKFQVGAAVEDCDGRIHTGCNVENATYGLTVCAERVAVFKAISEGVGIRKFRRVAIAVDTDTLTPPCGGGSYFTEPPKPLTSQVWLSSTAIRSAPR